MGNRVFSGSSDKTIRVWDLESCECTQTVTSDNAICSLLIAAGYLFSGSYQHIKARPFYLFLVELMPARLCRFTTWRRVSA
jgi:WD40 repeat protein